MPQQDPEARRSYRRDYYHRRSQEDPAYRDQLNKARNSHQLICQQCRRELWGGRASDSAL
jgi:hypothetical protein